MLRPCWSAVLTILLSSTILISEGQSYDFGSCPELSDPVGIHPSTKREVQAGRFEVVKREDEVVVTTLCDESSGWTLADSRFLHVRCAYNEKRQAWTWSHQHMSQATPPQIRCSSFSPRPLEQTYTLHNYQGCNTPDTRLSLTSQISTQLSTSLPCQTEDKCEVLSVSCWGLEGERSSKLAVLVEATMLARLEDQVKMLSQAARFLREDFKPVFHSEGATKRDVGSNPFDDNDPDNSTSADCTDGQKTVKVTHDNGTSSDYCVDCTAGTYANKADSDKETCEPCPYDTFSTNNTNAQCSDCPGGKGTLALGSDSQDSCQDVCIVPSVNYTSSMEPAAGERVLEGGSVTIHCDTNYYYGNQASASVVCNTNSSTNSTINFPSSCRSVKISTQNKTSIKEGSDVVLNCNVNATGYIPNYSWFRWNETDNSPRQLFVDGESSWNSPLFNISQFDVTDVGDYFCKLDYQDPILDDISQHMSLNILDVRKKPSQKTYVFAGDTLNLTCLMRVDTIYPKRAITWNRTNDQIISGITTRENEHDYKSILTLTSLEIDETGVYTCTAIYSTSDDSEKVSMREHMDVVVRGFKEEPEDVSVLIGKSFNLTCQLFLGDEVSADNTVLTWQKRKDLSMSWSKVIEDDRHEIAFSSYNYTSYSHLHVQNTSTSDGGEYRCVNTFVGEDKSTVATVTTYDLGIRQGPEDKAYLVGERAELVCEVAIPDNTADTVSVSWVKGEGLSETDVPDHKSFFNSTLGVSTLTFSSVSWADASKYKCKASYVVDGVMFSRESEKASLFVREISKKLDEYSMFNIPFYYDENGNMYDENKQNNSNNSDNMPDKYSFFCEYKGDANVGNVSWSVKNENGTVVPFMDDTDTELEKGVYNESTISLNTTLKLGRKFITENYKASLSCYFHPADDIAANLSSTTKFIVHAIRRLDKTVSSSASVNITCNYVGTDEPDSITWYVDNSPVGAGDENYEILPFSYDSYRRLRSDVLVVSSRRYSDTDKNISCVYSFSTPDNTLRSNTTLIYRGFHSRLQPDYYLAKDHGNVEMQCQMGVGVNGSAPDKTVWYLKDQNMDISPDIIMPGLFNISTDNTSINGLFTSKLTITDRIGIYTSLAGNYSCSFYYEDEIYSSSTILHTRMPYHLPDYMDVLYGFSPNMFPLGCYLDSDETPDNVTWSGPSDSVIKNAIKDSKIIDIDERENVTMNITLHFLNLTLPTSDDSGAYTCKFNFEKGPSVESTFPRVEFNDIEITNPSRVYATTSGVIVTLVCQVESREKLNELGWYDVDFEDWITPSNLTYNNVTNTTIATYGLQVNSTDDRGKFTCVLDEEQYCKKNISVIVLDLHPSFSGVVVADQGDMVSISCGLDYNSDLEEPTIAWYKDGELYQGDNIQASISAEGDMWVSVLTLNVNSSVANKKYHCVGNYSESDVASASDLVSDNVTILMTSMMAEQDYVMAAEGDDREFLCTAYSKQPATIFWRRTVEGGVQNITNNSYAVENTQEFVSQSILNLTNAKINDSSNSIECWFMPESGEEKYDTITLDVIDMNTVGREVTRDYPAVLTCSSSDPAYSSIDDIKFKWYRIDQYGQETEVSETSSEPGKSMLKFKSINDTDFTCLVYSEPFGTVSNATRTVSYKVFDITSPRNVTVVAGKAVTLTCEVTGNSGVPHFSWYKEDDSDTVLFVSNTNKSEYIFTPDSYTFTGNYYCNVTIDYDGESNGPFKSNVSHVIVRGLEPSFKNLTLVRDYEGKRHIEKLECVYSGDLPAIRHVEWRTPAGLFSQGDYAEFIEVTDEIKTDENTYKTVLNYNRNVENNEEFRCYFHIKNAGVMSESTRASVFSYTQLPQYTYNPTIINFTYVGKVDSNVTWFIDETEYDRSQHKAFTPGYNVSKNFVLTVNMNKLDEGADPVNVKAMIVFNSEENDKNVTQPYPSEQVETTVYKRDFVELLNRNITVPHNEADKTFTCLVAGDDNNVTFSWYIGKTELLDETENIDITEEADPADSDNRLKSTLTITEITKSPMYNDELKCRATWQDPEMFSVESLADLDTYGASIEPRFYTQVDGSAVLTCLVWGNVPPKSVVWMDENRDVVERDEKIEIDNKTVKTGQNDLHVHTLTFTSLKSGNEGNYTCAVTFQDDEIKELKTEVYLIGASFTSDSPHFVHDLNEEVELTCVYTGYREPNNVTWYMITVDGDKKPFNTSSSHFDVDTKPFDSTSNTQESTFTINKVEVKDSGNYECMWETEKFNVSATMVLAVRTLEAEDAVFYSTDGEISLLCEYEGSEEGTITWFYKSQPLNDEDETINIETGVFDDTNNAQTFKLEISEVTLKENSGMYTCALSFPDGDEVTATTKVVVRESAILSDYSWTENDDTMPLVYAEDDVLKMHCQLEADKVPRDVEWLYNGDKIQFDGVRKIMVNSLSSRMTWGLRYFSNVTLKGDDNVSDGEYSCKFTFFDEQPSGKERSISTTTHAKILTVNVSADEKCTFVDYEDEVDASLGCSFKGDLSSFNVRLRRSLMYLPNGKVRSIEVSKSLDYTVANVSHEHDGVYKCEFETNSEGSSGYPTFSATQRLISRKAMISSSTNKVLAGFTMTFNCNIPGGAKSISWFEDGKEISEYRTIDTSQTDNGLIEMMSISLRVKSTTSNNDTTKEYTCRGKIYDQFCPDVQEFSSAPWKVDVMSAEPIDGPEKYGNTSYEGDSYEFTCKFPNPMGDRSYNVYWTYNHKRILNNGDFYDNSGNRIIDGEINTDDEQSDDLGIPIIETRFKILAVDSNMRGKYNCGVTWRNGVMIKSDSAFLFVRYISQQPKVTNAVSGSAVTLRCTAEGDKAANISFHKITYDDSGTFVSTEISGSTQTDNSADDGYDHVVTEGQVTVTADSSFDYFYCNATWNNTFLTTDGVYFNVFETCENDETNVWGVLGSVVKIECLSDAALKVDEIDTNYLDENNRVVYADASVGWLYKTEDDSAFMPVDDGIRYSLESSWIGFDGLRRGIITIGPLESSYLDYDFVCSVTYNDSASHNFVGGNLRSNATKLKISNIQSFTTDSADGVIEGQTFTLSCTAESDTQPTFRISNDMRSLDKSRYTILNESTETSFTFTVPVHVAKYEIQSNFATVIQDGQDFYCSVDFGPSSPEQSKQLKITTYYNCFDAEISVLGKGPLGQTIEFENGSDGDRTATVKCPNNTDDTRYSIYESTQAKGKAVCTKDKGYYEPPYLATCLASHAFENGRFEQIWNLASAGETYCTDNSSGQFSKTNMTETLTTENSQCGPYPIVPCLKDNECTLDEENTGCRWDDAKKKLHVFYQVDFKNSVWTLQERWKLTKPAPGTKIKFWDCPDTLLSPSRRTPSKRGRLLDRMAVDQDSDMVVLEDEVTSKNYNALGVGIAGVVAAAIFIAALLYKRRFSRRSPHMTIGTAEFEMTDRSTVVTNHYSM